MAKKAKKQKQKKKKREAVKVVVRSPKVPLTPQDVLVGVVAGAFMAAALLCAGLAIRAAIFGDDYEAANRREAARLAAEAAEKDNIGGAIWFSQPDGTFISGADLQYASPAAGTPQAAPPIPSAQSEAPEEGPPAEPVEPEALAEASAAAGISTGLTAPGAMDWTVPVWVGQSDRNYHSRDDCEAADLTGARQTTIQEAVALGFQRCANCW